MHKPSESCQRQHSELPPTTHWVAEMVKRIGKLVGAVVNIEPEFGRVGSIEFPDGDRPVLFRGSYFSINPHGSVEIASDKAFASYFLRSHGYHTPKEQTFFSEEECDRRPNMRNIEDACCYADEIGFPVIIKPNNLSQGMLVTKAHSTDNVRKVAEEIFRRTKVILIQEFIQGKDYRVTILDGKVLSAYERTPLHVTGNGIQSILELLKMKQEIFRQQNRNTEINFGDPRMTDKLDQQNLTWNSIPSEDENVFLLDNSNLSTGGHATDVTANIHPDYRELTAQITKDMGLRFCGVDIMASDITKPLDPAYRIIEINAAPGLVHYALSGNAELDELYLKVLRAASKTG